MAALAMTTSQLTNEIVRAALIDLLTGALRGLDPATGVQDHKVPDQLHTAPGVATQDDRVLVSIIDAARMLSISRSAVYNEMNLGRLPTVQIGRRRLVPVAALREMASSYRYAGDDC